MKWKPWGAKDTAEITSDYRYSIHHGARGWQAWVRLPNLKRIGTLYELASAARQACEDHAAADKSDSKKDLQTSALHRRPTTSGITTQGESHGFEFE